MTWVFLYYIGIIAYAATGAFIALNVRFSFIGVYALGLITAFGGGIIRNLIIGVPVIELWDHTVIITVLTTLTVIILIPPRWIDYWKRKNVIFDSIGLASFAIQGAMVAKEVYPNDLGFIILAALFTGVGGGVIRDVIAGLKPLALKEEIHAILTVLCAVCIWLGLSTPLQLTLIVFVVVILRVTAIRFKWRLPLPIHLDSFKKGGM